MNHYEVLCVPFSATQAKIKKAYRRLALKLHPDKLHSSSISNEEEFKKLQTAYEVLSDPEKRRNYDAELCPPLTWFTYLGTLFTSCLNKPCNEEDLFQPAASPKCS